MDGWIDGWMDAHLLNKGYKRVQLRTTIAVYLCNKRSGRGSKGTPRTLGRVQISGNFFCQNKRTYSVLMLQAFLLVNAR